jgi:hypothetical protein
MGSPIDHPAFLVPRAISAQILLFLAVSPNRIEELNNYSEGITRLFSAVSRRCDVQAE